MKDYKIFVINPGSTSTKVAMFKGKEKIYSENIQHDVSELKAFKEVRDQLDYRRDMILESVKKSGETLTDVDAFSSRGGGCGTTESGVFTINETLLDYVTNRPSVVHPAILGAPIASALAEKYHAKAFIVNPPEVDEFKDLARVTGLKGVYRKSAIHALNQKEIGLRYAQKVGKNYSDLNLIICHIGGGISITAHEKGRMVDSNDIARGDGPMAPTRCGSLPVRDVVEMCYSGKYNHKSARILHGCGLFVSCGKILANGFKLQGTVLFLSKNGLIHGLIPVWMLTIHLLVFCFVKLRENLFLNLPKSRVPTPIF